MLPLSSRCRCRSRSPGRFHCSAQAGNGSAVFINSMFFKAFVLFALLFQGRRDDAPACASRIRVVLLFSSRPQSWIKSMREGGLGFYELKAKEKNSEKRRAKGSSDISERHIKNTVILLERRNTQSLHIKLMALTCTGSIQN